MSTQTATHTRVARKPGAMATPLPVSSQQVDLGGQAATILSYQRDMVLLLIAGQSVALSRAQARRLGAALALAAVDGEQGGRSHG